MNTPVFRKNRKDSGQVIALSTILMLTIVVVLVVAAYVWGSSLLEGLEERANSNYVRGKMLEVKRNIIEVVHEGVNSTRSVEIDLSKGVFLVYNGSSCSGSLIDRNGLIFNMSAKNRLIEAENESWIIIDPKENSTDCSASYTSNSPAVLLGKSVRQSGSLYSNEYFLWFREIRDDFGNTYAINIIQGASPRASGGTHTLIIRNYNSVNRDTNVSVNIL